MAVVKDERLRIIVLFLYAAVIAFVIILTYNTKAYEIALAPSGLFYSYWLEKANMTNVVSLFKQGTETPDYCKYRKFLFHPIDYNFHKYCKFIWFYCMYRTPVCGCSIVAVARGQVASYFSKHQQSKENLEKFHIKESVLTKINKIIST
jgi:hypothetical protein